MTEIEKGILEKMLLELDRLFTIPINEHTLLQRRELIANYSAFVQSALLKAQLGDA